MAPSQLSAKAHHQKQGQRNEWAVGIILCEYVAGLFDVVAAHDGIGEEVGGEELEDDDSGPAEDLRASDGPIYLRQEVLTSTWGLFTRT